MNESKRMLGNTRQWGRWREEGKIGTSPTVLPKWYGFTVKSIKADVAKLEAKKQRGVGSGAANRRFERFMMSINPGFRLDARREDQGGIWDEHDRAELQRQNQPVEIDPEEGELIATIVYDLTPGKEKVTVRRPGKPPTEM